jgi:hypothetical protein
MKSSTPTKLNSPLVARSLRLSLAMIAFAFVSHLPAQIFPDALALQGPPSGPGALFETTLDGSASYGQAVALDGDTMVVGAPFHHLPSSEGDETGIVFVYRRAGGAWTREQELQPAEPGYVNFGWSVAIAGDTLVVGAYGLSDFNGAIYIFERSGDAWSEVARRTATGGADYFGDTVAISGDLVVAGQIGDTSFRGAVHTFARNQGGLNHWGETPKLMAADGANGDEFGASVALSGNTLVVGAPYDDDQGNDSGSVYVYTRDPGSEAWLPQQKLVLTNGVANEQFGRRVVVEGNVLAAGTANNGFSRDNIRLWHRGGGGWAVGQGLRAAGGCSGLALSGSSLLAGSVSRYPDGAAYLFTTAGGAWSLTRFFTITPEVYFRAYGASVAVDDDTLVIGDPYAFRPGTTIQTGIAEVWAVDYGNTSALAGHLRKLLYYGDADDSPAFPKGQAAFRYQELLYTNHLGLTHPEFSRMAGLWGPAELQRSHDAEALLLKLLARTNAPAYGNLCLDIYYGRAAAEIILAKEQVAQAEQDRLGPPLGRVPPASGFVIDNEIERYDEAQSRFRTALARYYELFQLSLTVREPGSSSSTVAWANAVIGASSEWNPAPLAWSSAQALGAPDTYPNYGDFPTAWASATPNEQREYLELGYPATSDATEVHIYETMSPGAVDVVRVRNAANQTWHPVWSGVAAAAPPVARIFTVTFANPGFAIDGVRLELNSPAVSGWNEIDAVGLVSRQSTPDTDVHYPTFGYDLFRALVPARQLAPATVLVNGQPQPVTGDSQPLFAGYRDLVMLYGLLKDYGQNARQLAWLHWANGQATTARTVASEAQRYLLVNGALLDGIFPELEPETQTESGLDTAVAGYRAAVGDLAALLAQMAGDSTPLGFDRNFLMLVQKFQGQNPELFDSFNSIKDWLNPTPLSSQLRFAVDRHTAALTSYVTFRQNFDEVQEQFQQSTVSFEFRLFELTGARPGEPAYDAPQNNAGSEIWQQMQSLELARLRITRNSTEMENLRQEIAIEINRAANVQDVIVRYGDRQARLTEEISHARAAQAAAQAYADAFTIEPDKLNPFNIFFHAVNAGVQTGGELQIGLKEAEKERLAAGEKAIIEGIDSAARVQTLWLGMRTLRIDSQEAQLLMKQEAGRLAQLLREKLELERRLKERDANIARRYYADPIHRLNANYDILVANLAFDNAHKWLFFMGRALEYKWNVPFASNYLGTNWNAGSVFKCRNAAELHALYLAMLDFDAQIEGTRSKDDAWDWFSVREDFFGYRRLDDDGQPLAYFDAVTGETVSAIEMFRRRLRRDYLNVQSSQQSQLQLRFSTVRQIPGGSFFRGPRFNADGSILSRGTYLDKIRWLKIRLPGNHTTSPNPLVGSLSYGGSSFIRNEQVGTADPLRPDRVRNEFTEFSTRYWYRAGQQMQSLPGVTGLPDVWRFREAFTWDSAQMYKDSGPRLDGAAGQFNFPPSVLEIDAFRERSVAATDWRLTIPVRDFGSTVLNIDQLEDVEIYFYHYVVQRP